jgi:CheY-specific phosphatase CheX
VEIVKQLIRDCALRRMKTHSCSPEVEIEEVSADYNRTVHGNWMGLILVSGKDMRVTYKVHFNVKDVKVILAEMLGKDPSEISVGLSLDFIKEFCNLTAGNIKQVLEEQAEPIATGISLPIVTKGFDDLFYQPSTKDEIQELWRIRVGGVGIYVTPHVNIFDTSKLQNVQLADANAAADDDDGDIDFL